jgi:predicted transposase YdaD
MAEAKQSLEELSFDPDVRASAYKRETALRGYYHTLAAEREESEARGEARGEAKGRVEGVRNTLERLLSKRFGELPDWAVERISHADLNQLEIYLDDVITAQSLDDVLRRND